MFLECKTYRFRAHSMYDPELYRGKAEVEQWKQRDPISTLAADLRRRQVLTDVDYQQMETAVAAEIEQAVAYGEAGTWEPVEDLQRVVLSERKAV